MKIVLVPDSFKGTMSSIEVCDIMEASIKKHFANAQVVALPVADGGEGTVDCFLSAMGGSRIVRTVKGPYNEPLESFYGIVDNGQTAVIEMAAASGLPLVGDNKQPDKTTTFGVGELIIDALERGCQRIILGLGGSCTNDLGCGMAAAVGVTFTNKDGASFIPTGGTLCEIAHIDKSKVDPRLSSVSIEAMCDIDNPLFGERGAAYIFSPQKGANPEIVKFLDDGLRAASEVIKQDLHVDVSDMRGAGAAGGMGGGVVAFLGAELKMGIEAVLDTVHFSTIAQDAQLVLTGEGKLDTQSLRGKVVVGVGQRAQKLGVPVVAVVGDAEDVDVTHCGVKAVFTINRRAVPFEIARKTSKQDLSATMDSIMALVKIFAKE
ncbi:putative Glycerate kinase [Blattamonas nauphoetae]|uniref:Glycerate kinase n=1 Tax=Blattamonas nauphoetae TaxID=2049346 RepID=A0ABQ9XYS3_9EUKA|nr:putative Glycerate kinase [Blattamonas nauphoetae]